MSASSTDSDGQKYNLSFQQGVEWRFDKIDWTLVPFGRFTHKESNKKEQSWNNVLTTGYGIKLRNEFSFGSIKWGEANVGIEKVKNHYHDGETEGRENERTEIFLRMYVSGDWLQ